MANAKAKNRSARTVAAVSATPTSRRVGKPALKAEDVEPVEAEDEVIEPEQETRPAGPPLWLQFVTYGLAVLGLAISAYETYAHFNGSHLAGCPTGGHGTFNCTAVITSPQSMVFGVIPVAVLGLAFYVAAVPLFSPWGWRMRRREVHLVRLVSVVRRHGLRDVPDLRRALPDRGHLRVLHRRAHRDVPAVLHHRVQRRHLGARAPAGVARRG